jgi:hypothetical protein
VTVVVAAATRVFSATPQRLPSLRLVLVVAAVTTSLVLLLVEMVE